MGLNYQELQELLQYIEKNHSWKNMYDLCYQHKESKDCPKIIKYITFDFDTRDCDIWRITFRQIQNNAKECEISFRTEEGYKLKDKIYKWLTE